MINLKLIQLFECFCLDCTNCTCYFFLDKAICYHIVACCLLDDINYLGLKDKQFHFYKYFNILKSINLLTKKIKNSKNT
ncbi:hypothetical protein BpHYR1_015882 [Brachionus plicatilis]|uniref:SWIM-type domain-containing protein n=1 Tax=Brachionus plicatilis TaxID=10195 RepID=A0A3M7QX93_BRAPC|nr:hypothetical protein BpHYR1_015882 [Brachionus plicatilis]